MIMITGGAGFIGLNFVKFLVENKYASPDELLVVDKIGYASHAEEIFKYARVAIVDIADKDKLESLFMQYDIEGVVNFAAESHVDRSIADCMPFVTSNIIGTINVAQLCVKYEVIKLLHISTDEVFGEVPYPGKFNEYSNLNPRNPYSASKASAECFINAFINTHKLRAVIVNMSNNYGPFQNEEKLIPLTIKKLMNNEFVPVYGNGKQIRDWIYVEDACRAIYKVFIDGKVGERYCIGGDNEIQNIDIVNMIMKKMGVEDRIQYVQDRPGHDTRYYTDTTKLKALGWSPRWSLSDGLDATIEWMKSR